jgi:vesicle coat complex subunit
MFLHDEGRVAGPQEVVVHAQSAVSCPQDDDPYVRKTAAICVAKLFDINAELVQDRGFLDTLVVRVCT